MSTVAARHLGELPLSMGTSRALESLLGVSLESRKLNKPRNVVRLMVNTRTVLRNFLEAMEGRTYLEVAKEDLYPSLAEEFSQIHYLAKGYSHDIEVVLYLCHYRTIERDYPNATFKRPRSGLQLALADVMDKVVLDLPEIVSREYHRSQLTQFSNSISGRYPGKTLIITHQPIDLLSYGQFTDLELLESYTGAIKPRNTWHSKLTVKANPHIPFNRFTMTVFGDNQTFSPKPLAIRKAVEELAASKNWTAITTREKIVYNIQNDAPKELREELLGYL